MFAETLTQQLAIPVTPVHAQTINNTTLDTVGVNMSKFERVMFLCDVGTNAASASVIFKLQDSPTVGGTYTDITGGATTAITTASKIKTLEIRADQLNASAEFVRCRATESAAQVATITIIPLAGFVRHRPETDSTQVTERLVV